MTRHLTIIFVLALLLAACGGKKAQDAETVGWEDVGEYFSDRDSTVYGICTDGTSMNVLQMLTDSGDTLTVNVAAAKENNMVFGGFAVGDRMAVLTNDKKTEATMVVNQSTLMGDWVTPNPMDGSSEMGISIRDGGVAESINMGALIYQSWRLYNGAFEIVSTRDDGANFEETTRYQLLYLTSDSLAFKDGESTYEYTRPSKGGEYDDVDLELDEGSFEDFVM